MTTPPAGPTTGPAHGLPAEQRDWPGMDVAGLRILVYTVNDLERARELARWGVDAVCTDRIDLISPAALDDIDIA